MVNTNEEHVSCFLESWMKWKEKNICPNDDYQNFVLNLGKTREYILMITSLLVVVLNL